MAPVKMAWCRLLIFQKTSKYEILLPNHTKILCLPAHGRNCTMAWQAKEKSMQITLTLASTQINMKWILILTYLQKQREYRMWNVYKHSHIVTIYRRHKYRGWICRWVSFFLQVGQHRWVVMDALIQGSQNTWPHTVEINCLPLLCICGSESQVIYTYLGIK